MIGFGLCVEANPFWLFFLGGNPKERPKMEGVPIQKQGTRPGLPNHLTEHAQNILPFKETHWGPSSRTSRKTWRFHPVKILVFRGDPRIRADPDATHLSCGRQVLAAGGLVPHEAPLPQDLATEARDAGSGKSDPTLQERGQAP